MDLIYLNFDGITHPGDVWYEPASRQARLRAPGHELFESLPILELHRPRAQLRLCPLQFDGRKGAVFFLPLV